MSLVDSQLEWQEQDLDCSILVALLDLQLLLLDVERLGDAQRSQCISASSSRLLFLACSTAFASSSFALIGGLVLSSSGTFAAFDHSVALVLDGNIEEDLFVESVVDLKINLKGLVELG